MFTFFRPQSIHFGRGHNQQDATVAKGFGNIPQFTELSNKPYMHQHKWPKN